MRFTLPAFALAAAILAAVAISLGSGGDGASAQSPVTVTMAAGRDGNQTGTATLTDTSGGLQVVVDITPHSDPAASQLAHIHNGQCPNVGSVAHTLTPIVNGQSTTTLSGVTLASVQTGAFNINVHDPADPSMYTSCGNIPAAQATATPTPTAGATATATPASVPQTGGATGDGGASALTYAAIALGLLAVGGGALFAPKGRHNS
jgi:hypothetical protein